MLKKISLTKDWSFFSKNQLFRTKVNLPSSNFVALFESGYIPDPFIGKREETLFWVAELDWIYEKKFLVSKEDLSHKNIFLFFDKIDTVAEVILNGKKLFSSENAHLCYKKEVKNFLVEGENILTVNLFSPVQYVREKQKELSLPGAGECIAGYPHIRKPSYQFGWDWAPSLPESGIGKDVSLILSDGASIDSVRVEQTFLQNAASLQVTVQVKEYSENTKVILELFSPEGVSLSKSKTVAFSEKDDELFFTSTIKVDSPKLWDVNGSDIIYSAPPLYSLKVSAFEENTLSEEKCIKVGIRELSLSTDSDGIGRDFCFIINGRRIFAKGANYIPTDSFSPRESDEKLEELFVIMRESGFNMVRVWGGGNYASEKFMSLADEYGILVWHDLPFACAPYPFRQGSFRKQCEEDIRQNIKRLRTHPSLCLICGNNEVEAMSPIWSHRVQLKEDNRYFFYNTAPQLVRELTDIPYWAGSPGSGEYMKRIGDDNYGDTHLWGVWHGMKSEKAFLKRKSRFCSEFGTQSFPAMETVMSMLDDKKGKLRLKHPHIKQHQKSGGGNDKILYYMIKNYRVPASFEHFVYLSQLNQAESVSLAVNHFRRNTGRCNGALYWQLNDCWQSASWSGVDYFGRMKALQYYAKEFFRPVQISLVKNRGAAEVFVINDSKTTFEGKLKVRIVNFSGKIMKSFESAVQIPSYKVLLKERLVLKNYISRFHFNKCAVVAEIEGKEGEILSSSTLLLVKDRDAKLSKSDFSFTINEENNLLHLRASSRVYARKVMLEAEGIDKNFSRNFFDMEGGRIYDIYVEKSELTTADSISKKLKFTSYADIKPRRKRWKERLKAIDIVLKPVNFFNIVSRIFE